MLSDACFSQIAAQTDDELGTHAPTEIPTASLVTSLSFNTLPRNSILRQTLLKCGATQTLKSLIGQHASLDPVQILDLSNLGVGSLSDA